MIVIIILAIIAFLYWSLVPAKPKQPTLDELINTSQRKNGEYSNVYLSELTKRTLGFSMYYEANSPIDPSDKKVFTGTKNECLNYVSKYSHKKY